MSTTGKIRYCTSHEIDFIKWDTCIEQASNGLIYAYSFYLDIMSPQWHALILDDYAAVMPLTWNRKYGFYYLYQPYFMRALGVFGKNITANKVSDFLSAVPSKFRYWNIDLNETNTLNPASNSNLSLTVKDNYHLGLQYSYEELYSRYRKSCQQRLRKAGRNHITIFKDGKPADVINFYQEHYGARHPKISSEVYQRLIDLANLCVQKDQATVYLARLPNGEITAAKLILSDKKFVYSLIGGSSEAGKQMASYYLTTDASIKDHAGSGKIFRFEGSLIPGIASFSNQFGSYRCDYSNLHKNSLPFPFNFFKR